MGYAVHNNNTATTYPTLKLGELSKPKLHALQK